MGAKTVNAADMVTAYKAGMAGAGGKWLKGIQSVQQNPAQAALATVQSGQWLAAVSASVPRLEAGLASVTTQSWQAAAAAAQGQYTGSATKAALKFQAKSQQVAQAATAASAAAAAVTGSTAKFQAAANAMRAAFGKGPIS